MWKIAKKKEGGCGNPVSFVLTTYRRYVKLRKVKSGAIYTILKKYKTEKWNVRGIF